ncbi:hypothetical protein MtrunA17_Chr5g0417231 [Medicago truncatula]|nr:hypothetical protein MtrunA17_Chr5g0417231 [Medicago truncatula]
MHNKRCKSMKYRNKRNNTYPYIYLSSSIFFLHHRQACRNPPRKIDDVVLVTESEAYNSNKNSFLPCGALTMAEIGF